jgi:tetratricopeptide (TPR) repeat protein
MEKTEPLTDQNSNAPTDYERLVRFLISPGPTFGFAIARYVDPRVRDRLIDQATRDAQAAGLRAETLNLSRTKLEGHPNLADLLEQRLRPKKTEPSIRAVFIVQLEKFLIDPFGEARVSPSISVLNQSRDLLPRRIGARVVLWLTDAAANTFATFSHDLYDVALTHFRFEDHDDPMPITQYGNDIPEWLIAANDEDFPRLQREASLLKTVFRSATNTASKADAAFRIAQIYAILSKSTKAKEWFEIALELYRETNDKTNEGKVYLRYSDFFYVHGKLDETNDYAENALAIYNFLKDERMIAESKDRIANIFQDRGQLDEALEIRQNQILPICQKLGMTREEAITQGKIADILQTRGQFDQALEIRQNQQLPVYQKLGDIRAEAVTRGKIADILETRGQLDQALDIRQNHELPVYIKLGDIRLEAITRGKIADILQVQGQLDEALEIYQNQILSIFQKLGDIRLEAITRERIAGILQAQGQLDQALEIQLEQVLPVHKKLGDKRSILIAEANIAILFYQLDRPEDKPEIASLLQSALQAAREMRIPEADYIENLMRQIDLTPESR